MCKSCCVCYGAALPDNKIILCVKVAVCVCYGAALPDDKIILCEKVAVCVMVQPYLTIRSSCV